MLLTLVLLMVRPRTPLAVGDGKPFSRIEDAVRSAQPGDEIDVYPKAGGYAQTAVKIHTPGLKIVGTGAPVVIDGSGFEYSGQGSVPRAIFQIDAGADDVTIQNFELRGAHNRSFNGAGVRINAGNRVQIVRCDIHDNDMGIMSNGIEGNLHAGEDQLIDHCHIHANGNPADPGYNHNLYLGGTSVTVQFCEIDHSLTGHNLKCRAHFTLVQYNVIRASANRELDFVDAWDTRRPHSNAVLIGNVIAKDPACPGNRVTINFGQENGRRDGTLYLLNNTVSTPFHSAVVNLSAPTAQARFVNDVFENLGDAHPVLVGVEKGALLINVSGGTDVLSPGYDITGTTLAPSTLYVTSTTPPVATGYEDGLGTRHPLRVTHRYVEGRGWFAVKSAKIGADN